MHRRGNQDGEECSDVPGRPYCRNSECYPVCLTRKNALFAGHEVGADNWLLLASVVAICKLNDVNPAAYVAETLETIIDGHPHSRIEDLMPWRFRKTSSQPQ
ncbi:transposase domain-containing protein [Bradyrhizobium lupini]|uniref:transposase domain-containing protein n=1 Tax=Rhizobium lupini TaxID=136996 RepID=UPI0034C65BA8